MDRTIAVEVTVSQELYRRMVYFQMFQKKKLTLPLMTAAWLVALGVVAARLAGAYDVLQYSFGRFSYYACVAYLFFPVLSLLFVELQVRRIAGSGRTVIGQSHCILIGEQGVASQVGDTRAEFGWQEILQAHELREVFLFYISEGQALALARGDVSPEQAALIRELAQEKLGDRYRLHTK